MKFALLTLFLLAILLTPLYPIYALEDSQKMMYRKESTSPARLNKIPPLKYGTPSGNLKPILFKTATSAGGLLEFKQRKQERKDEFKNKLANFKDEKKAERTDKINTNLEAISERILGFFSSVLEKFLSILERAETKLEGMPEGTEKTEAQSAINKAKASIAASQDILDGLSIKDYTIEVTSEETVREEAMNTRNSLKDDLSGARNSLIQTQKDVVDAIRAVNAVSNQGGSNGQ